MDTFFPSEIARLVLGYLKEDKCLKSWQTFLEESSNLREYFTLFKTGKVYSTNVNGYSLLDILNEYCVLKFQAINQDTNTENFSSNSEIIETLKEDSFIESTKQTVDCVFQENLSPSHNLKDNVSSESSHDVCKLLNHNCGSGEIKNYCTDVAENLSGTKSYHCDEQNAISAKNNVINRNKSYELDKAQGYEKNKILDIELSPMKTRNSHLRRMGVEQQNKDFLNSNTSSQSLNSFIQSLSDKLKRNENSAIKLQNVGQHRHALKDINQSLSKSKPSNEESTISSTKTIQCNDDDIEIIEEINKEKKCSDNLSLKDRTCCSNSTSTNKKAIDNIVEENSKINESRHKTNSSNNSNDEVQTISIKDVRTEQTDENEINALESKTDSSNNQVSFVNSGTFIQSSTDVNKIAFSYPQNYIFPSYAPSNSFSNNAPVYVVLNTPNSPTGPIINRTILTLPTVQTNTIPCPVLPAVSTAYVNNSITAVKKFSSPLPAENTVTSEDKFSLASSKVPLKEISTASSVGLLNTVEKKNISKTEVGNKVLQNSLKTYSKESQLALQLFSQVSVGLNDDESSKVPKRKNFSQRTGQTKKTKNSLRKDQLIPTPEVGIFSLIDYKGEHSNQDKCKISCNSFPSKVRKVTIQEKSKEKKDKRSNKNNKTDMSPPILKVKIIKPKTKTSCYQSVLKEHFPQHDEIEHHLNPSNIISKTEREVNDCTKSINTFSTSQNNYKNSTLIKSNVPGVEENRVLKVMLSDIFVDIHHKIDSFHDQGSDFTTELSMQEMHENQISDPENITQ